VLKAAIDMGCVCDDNHCSTTKINPYLVAIVIHFVMTTQILELLQLSVPLDKLKL